MCKLSDTSKTVVHNGIPIKCLLSIYVGYFSDNKNKISKFQNFGMIPSNKEIVHHLQLKYDIYSPQSGVQY